MMSQAVRCHVCQTTFSFDPEALRPYHDSLIQGRRAPRYWVRCPNCGVKNVIELVDEVEVIPGKPSAR